jgi:hypothetical protein
MPLVVNSSGEEATDMRYKALSVVGLGTLGVLAAACSGPAATTSSQPPRIVQTSFSLTSGTIAVPASNYRVVVTTSGPSFVQADHGTNGAVLFAGVVPAGQTHTFAAENGKVTVLLGSVQNKVTVQLDGKRVPGWRYTPTTAPFTLDFSSVS